MPDMSNPSRAGAALVAAIASGLGLAGCATGPSEEAMEANVVSAVSSVDHVTGAFASFSSSGGSGKDLLVNLYVDTTDEAVIVATADESLRAIWQSVGIRPYTVSIAVATIAMPDHPSRLEGNAINPAPIAEGLAIADARTVRQLLLVEAGSMEERYGAWSEPAA